MIEGWALLPDLVSGWLPATARAVWLVVDHAVFHPRVRENRSFYAGAPDEEGMISRLAARSIAFDVYLRTETAKHGLPTIELGPHETAEATLCRLIAFLSAR